jgi:hypothetical protein
VKIPPIGSRAISFKPALANSSCCISIVGTTLPQICRQVCRIAAALACLLNFSEQAQTCTDRHIMHGVKSLQVAPQ